jgi:hypothetical protein
LFFLFDEFLPLGYPKKSSVTHAKDFCEKDVAQSPDLRDFFL